MEKKSFECSITKYRIEYILNPQKDIALFNIVESDYKNMKAYLALLRSSVDQLKGMNIKFIMQCITFDDWTNFLDCKTSWQIHDSNDKQEIHMIKCDIDDFLENYGVGIGL